MSDFKSFKKIYIFLMSIVGTVFSVVYLGLFSYNLLEKIVISDSEYVYLEDNIYKLEICSHGQLRYDEFKDKDSVKKISDEEETKKQKECRENKIKDIVNGRNVEFKKNLISYGLWFVLFFSITMIYLPKFLKTKNNKTSKK